MTVTDPINILLVDASHGHLRKLEPQLQSAGLRTFIADDCQKILSEARLGKFDVVVIGERLLDVDNMDLPHILRAVNSAGSHLPIIWIPDKLDPQQIMAALELKIDIVLDRNTPLPILLSYFLNFGKKKRYADGMLDSVVHLRKLLENQAQQVDELKDNNSKLRELSMTDPLTGLFNARYMRQWLTQSFAYAVRHETPLSVIFIDLDHFKWINDCYGHLAGDKALQVVGSVLKNCVRDSDLAARYAGDEFLLALPDTPSRQLEILARRINEELKNNKLQSGGEEFHITCSMGSATFPEEETINTYSELLNLADQALYAAKRTGREQLAMWHNLSSEHHKAINVNQLSTHI